MTHRAFESVWHPDSHLAVPISELPQRPVRVMVVVLDDEDDTATLSDIGDYQLTLEDYEGQLAQGAIQW